jgi:hypothetical protein
MQTRHPLQDAGSTRCGTTLVELLVALTTTLVVLSIGAMAATRSVAIQSTSSANGLSASTRNSAVTTLSRHLANVVPQDGELFTVRDTVLEFMHTIGVASVCAIRGDTIITSRGLDSLPWHTTLPRAITSDDRLRVWSDSAAAWRTASVRATGSASGACGTPDRPWPGSAWQRVTLDSGAYRVAVGALIRVQQRERWSLLRSGDGSWALALATWDASRGRYGVPQPVMAPLNAPSAPDGAGLEVRALDSTGTTLATADLARANAITIILRSAARPLGNAGNDSVQVNVPAH